MVIERKKKGGKGEGGGLVGGDESQKWTNLGRSQKWVFLEKEMGAKMGFVGEGFVGEGEGEGFVGEGAA